MDTHFHFTIIGFSPEDRNSQIMDLMRMVEPSLFPTSTMRPILNSSLPGSSAAISAQPLAATAEPVTSSRPAVAATASRPPTSSASTSTAPSSAPTAAGLATSASTTSAASTASSAAADAPEILQCAICFELDPPKLLPCGHGCCTSCLIRWRRTRSICPEPYCKKPFEIDQVITIKRE